MAVLQESSINLGSIVMGVPLEFSSVLDWDIRMFPEMNHPAIGEPYFLETPTWEDTRPPKQGPCKTLKFAELCAFVAEKDHK